MDGNEFFGGTVKPNANTYTYGEMEFNREETNPDRNSALNWSRLASKVFGAVEMNVEGIVDNLLSEEQRRANETRRVGTFSIFPDSWRTFMEVNKNFLIVSSLILFGLFFFRAIRG